MDIAERRRPQDGRITITVGEKELDLRVSVIPTNHGQSTVMRLLDKDNIKVGVKQLGLGERDFKVFTSLIKRPNGILLVTGPTGSGKTTTLYAALNALNRPDRKIITAEDPVEYYLPGINQVEVRHNIGLDFARIIRAMLRQAPNIILVGEMRDTETAQMGIQASLTGHLVFSTLHTNDAPSAVTANDGYGSARPTWSPARLSPLWPSAWCGRFAPDASIRSRSARLFCKTQDFPWRSCRSPNSRKEKAARTAKRRRIVAVSGFTN